MFIGAVKWFDNNKGFGILALPLGEELFVHIRGFKTFPEEGIQQNKVIIGNKKLDPKRNSHIAHNCHVLKHSEDWKIVISLLGKEDIVMLPDKRRKEKKHSLMTLAAEQLLQGQDEEGIFNMLTSVFDSSFEPSLFIPYAEFLEKSVAGVLEETSVTRLFSRVFEYFGTQITHAILFKVWKEKKFKYIGYESGGDYEIPEGVLNLNATEIDYNELARIKAYSFGKSFCSDFVSALFDGLDGMNKEEMDSLLPYLEFLENGDKEYWFNIVRT